MWMRREWFITALLLAGGCSHSDEVADADRAALNAWMVDSWHDASTRQAAVDHRTIYSHYFEPTGRELNELGQRQLEMMLDLYRETPGPLVVRPGDASQELYQARVQRLRDVLADAGVRVQEMQFMTGPAGGDGEISPRVRFTVEQKMDAPLTDVTQGETLSGGVVNTVPRSGGSE